MFEHFPAVHLIKFIMLRGAPAMSDQPSMVPTQQQRTQPDGTVVEVSDQPPAPVRRYPHDDLRCPACSYRLSTVIYDPIDHLFHSVEYGCPNCQDIYAGVLMHSGDRLIGSLLRTRLAI